MSVKIMTWVWEQKLDARHKLLLLAIADNCDDHGENAWPSIARLCEKISASESTVHRLLATLEANGWIKIEKNAGGTGATEDRYRPNLYSIQGCQTDTPRDSGVSKRAARGVKTGDSGVSPLTPSTSYQPSIEHPSPSAPPPAQPEWSKIADRLAKEYHARNKLEGFMGILNNVRRAFEAGYDSDEIMQALNKIELDGQTVTSWRLKQTLESSQKRRDARMYDENGMFRA